MAAADQVRGHLDMLILAVLTEEPAHGYAIVEALRERSGGTFDLPEGTVYPALHRLEAAGVLASKWSDAGGRRRRVYSLTRRGRSVLAAKRDEWAGFVGAIQAVMRGAPWPSTT
jgi:transcriptional regulator